MLKIKNDFDFKTQYGLNFKDEIIVDLFAGGGGASTGMEMGSRCSVDVAINHDENAISMHTANHPHAKHYISDIYEVCPVEACAGRDIALLHASPDCTHHSQASGGQPRKKSIRSLSWIVHKWAGKKKPKIITLENVEQILNWSPLVAKRCKKTGRVVTLEEIKCEKTGRTINRIAEPGEVIAVQNQFLVPNKKKKGKNWKQFVNGLRHMGYAVQFRVIPACYFGAPTTRERLYLIARCDGKPIVWPEQTNFKNPSKGQKKFRSVAECIDWSIPCKSIFGRPKSLAEATLKRIAKGIQKYVLDSPSPYIVKDMKIFDVNCLSGPSEPLNQFSAQKVFITEHANASNQRNMSGDEPLRTICATVKGGHFALVTANMLKLRGQCDAHSIEEPIRTISAGGEHHGLVTAFLTRHFGASVGQSLSYPAPTIMANGGGKSGLVEVHLAKDQEEKALQCASFLLQYYSEGGQWCDLNKPMNAITTRDRMALVTVWIAGDPWVIVDIQMRMLQPRELYRAQGFPDNYIIEKGHDGRKFTKQQQVKFVGNSVSPLPMAAIVAANWFDEKILMEKRA